MFIQYHLLFQLMTFRNTKLKSDCLQRQIGGKLNGLYNTSQNHRQMQLSERLDVINEMLKAIQCFELGFCDPDTGIF